MSIMADMRRRIERGVETMVLPIFGRRCFEVCGCEAERIAAIVRISLSPTFRVIGFLFCQVGILKGAQKVAQMGRLGDNIERKS